MNLSDYKKQLYEKKYGVVNNESIKNAEDELVENIIICDKMLKPNKNIARKQGLTSRKVSFKKRTPKNNMIPDRQNRLDESFIMAQEQNRIGNDLVDKMIERDLA